MTHIDAMKQGLEALEVEDMACRYEKEATPEYIAKAITSLRQAIEQAEKQEPVVWMYQDKSTHEVRFQKHMRSFVDHGATYETPLYTAPQPQRELNCVCGAVWEGDEMVCVPHKREWVGLTDEDWVEIFGNSRTIGAAVRNTEAKLKEKNCL